MEVLATSLTPQLLPTAASSPVPASSSDAERFAQLMAPPPQDLSAVANTVAVQQAGTPAIGAHAPVGDRILQGMQNISQDLQKQWSAVQQTLNDGGNQLSMQDMLKLQLHLTQASVQYEVLGKAISKSTQNFDQLVRVQ